MSKGALFTHEMMLNCSLPLEICADEAVERAANGERTYIIAANDDDYVKIIQYICAGREIPTNELCLIHVMQVDGI